MPRLHPLIESALVVIESALLPLESALLPLESALFAIESALLPLESALLQLESALFAIESALLPRGAGAATGTTELRLLLARAYFHLAQLGRAEAVLVELVEKAPTDAYADLLLGRTLQRAGRHEEAKSPLALAEILADYERPKAQGDVLSLSAVPVVYGSVSAQMGTLIGWD